MDTVRSPSKVGSLWRCVLIAKILAASVVFADVANGADAPNPPPPANVPAADEDEDDDAPPSVDVDAIYDIDTIGADGLERTKLETLVELTPRPLPARLSGREIVEITRRIRNLELFDLVVVTVKGRELHVHVRRKVTIQPIFEFSTGKSLADTAITLGAVENDIDGHGSRLGGKVGYEERTFRFALWLFQHTYRPKAWAHEYSVAFEGSAFRFEGAGETSGWQRQRLGGETSLLLPFTFGSRFRFELQAALYRETFVRVPLGDAFPMCVGRPVMMSSIRMGKESEYPKIHVADVYEALYRFQHAGPAAWKLQAKMNLPSGALAYNEL